MTRYILYPLFLLAALSTTPAAAGDAPDTAQSLAEDPLPEIQETGIAAFDDVFGKVKAIHGTLGDCEGHLLNAEAEIAKGVGLDEGASIAESMWALKQTAQGPVEVELRDGKPTLTVGGAGSDEVEEAIEAVNDAATHLTEIVAQLAELPAQAAELVDACKQFPSQLNASMLSDAGMGPMQLPKVAKTVSKNVKAASLTTDRITRIVGVAEAMLVGIPDGLTATEPPAPRSSSKTASKSKTKKAKKAKAGKTDKKAMAMSPTDLELPDTALARLINAAWAAFNDAEVETAARILDAVDRGLGAQDTPISTEELTALYQTEALIQLVSGDLEAAEASVGKALAIDPGCEPMWQLGEQYADLHARLCREVELQTVRIEIKGAGKALISGREVYGNTLSDVQAGRHLVQIQRGDDRWASRVLFLEEGTVIEL